MQAGDRTELVFFDKVLPLTSKKLISRSVPLAMNGDITNGLQKGYDLPGSARKVDLSEALPSGTPSPNNNTMMFN